MHITNLLFWKGVHYILIPFIIHLWFKTVEDMCHFLIYAISVLTLTFLCGQYEASWHGVGGDGNNLL
jgi:hypothetical protein